VHNFDFGIENQKYDVTFSNFFMNLSDSEFPKPILVAETGFGFDR